MAFLISVEAISVYLQQHYSVAYRRVSQQIAQAIGARPTGPGKPTSVVLIGNSLFLAGVQVDRLEELRFHSGVRRRFMRKYWTVRHTCNGNR
jgi:hypothetical protein